MRIRMHPENPQPRLVTKVAQALDAGQVIIFPTDTVYGMGCDVLNRKAAERIYRLKKVDRRKPLSILCPDLSVLSEYVASIPTSTFRILKRLTPGPYTWILEASGLVPRTLLTRQRTIGIRVPDAAIPQALIRELGRPILSTSIRPDDDEEPVEDPDDIDQVWGRRVDMVVDGGFAVVEYSTVVDLTSGYPEIVREGKGDISSLLP